MSHGRLLFSVRCASLLVASAALRASSRRIFESHNESLHRETALSADNRQQFGLTSKEEGLRVLTYNICWGCMEGDPRDATGMKGALKKICQEETWQKGTTGENGLGGYVTKCAENIGGFVERAVRNIGGYDLMAFQEASNFDNLYLDQKGIIDQYGMRKVVHSEPIKNVYHDWGPHKDKQKRTWIVSLYDSKRMGTLAEQVGGGLKDDPGRPYLILIFDSSKTIFINLHNCQPGKGKFKRDSWVHFLEDMYFCETKKLKSALEKRPERKDYRIILAGDFNDLEGALPGTIEVPWKKDVKLNIKRPLADTCCTSDLGKEVKHGGDYIFDSAGEATNRVPDQYQSWVAQSDHQPVEAVLSALGSVKPARKHDSGRRLRLEDTVKRASVRKKSLKPKRASEAPKTGSDVVKSQTRKVKSGSEAVKAKISKSETTKKNRRKELQQGKAKRDSLASAKKDSTASAKTDAKKSSPSVLPRKLRTSSSTEKKESPPKAKSKTARATANSPPTSRQARKKNKDLMARKKASSGRGSGRGASDKKKMKEGWTEKVSKWFKTRKKCWCILSTEELICYEDKSKKAIETDRYDFLQCLDVQDRGEDGGVVIKFERLPELKLYYDNTQRETWTSYLRKQCAGVMQVAS